MNDLVPLTHAFDKKSDWKKAATPAGAALLLIALGWSAGAGVDALRGPSPEQIAAKTATETADKALRAEEAHKQEIAALRVHVDNLKNKLETQAQKSRDAEAAVAAMQKSLADEKAQAQASAQQMQARLDRLQAPKPVVQAQAPLPPARPLDPRPTASIGKPLPVVTQPPRPVTAASAKPYRGYVLRDVTGGRAVVEGGQGFEEVGPGDMLPGGARVQSIVKRGGGWVVMTDRGYIAPDGNWED